jgi:hypothetical protein
MNSAPLLPSGFQFVNNNLWCFLINSVNQVRKKNKDHQYNFLQKLVQHSFSYEITQHKNPIYRFFVLGIVGVESNWVHSSLRPPMVYSASPRWLWWWRNWWNHWQGKPKYLEETCPSAAFSTTNPMCWPDASPGRHVRKPASKPLSYGTTHSLKTRKTYMKTMLDNKYSIY